MMTEQFSVTLHNIHVDQVVEAGAWLKERGIEHTRNYGSIRHDIDEPFNCVSYSFTNDDDAMLFKLTWSDYL